jgi:hypothetical protein
VARKSEVLYQTKVCSLSADYKPLRAVNVHWAKEGKKEIKDFKPLVD